MNKQIAERSKSLGSKKCIRSKIHDTAQNKTEKPRGTISEAEWRKLERIHLMGDTSHNNDERI